MRLLKLVFFTLIFLLLGLTSKGQNDTINQRVHGKREGYWIKHRVSGQVKWEGYYVKGEKTGYWKIYDRDGFHYEGKLIDGNRIGKWYLVDTKSGTRLDMTVWDGKGNCVGGATLSW
jgi:antitoxin component YwqK of YwqJK toxin-antitoxin module